MTKVVNNKIVVSTPSYTMTDAVYKVVKEWVVRTFGESSIVASGVDLLPNKYTGLYYGRIFLNLDKPLEEFLKEVT